ncbi:hypothetical protein GY45DRAFT_662427 [Cubamyces sp. BRFM 1775]|nr:hypothetical protein GY45DRAFT_662427 [Cubamyces sp. BRFM 1775]
MHTHSSAIEPACDWRTISDYTSIGSPYRTPSQRSWQRQDQHHPPAAFSQLVVLLSLAIVLQAHIRSLTSFGHTSLVVETKFLGEQVVGHKNLRCVLYTFLLLESTLFLLYIGITLC